jgi:hypothetical protein
MTTPSPVVLDAVVPSAHANHRKDKQQFLVSAVEYDSPWTPTLSPALCPVEVRDFDARITIVDAAPRIIDIPTLIDQQLRTIPAPRCSSDSRAGGQIWSSRS